MTSAAEHEMIYELRKLNTKLVEIADSNKQIVSLLELVGRQLMAHLRHLDEARLPLRKASGE